MTESLTRTLARQLIASGQLIVGEAARAAGAQRASVAYWTRDLDARAARTACLVQAWSALKASLSALPDRALAELVLARGLATPTEIASILNLDVQTVYRWAGDLDHKATRRVFCASLWSRELDRLAREQAEYKKQADAYHEAAREGYFNPDGTYRCNGAELRGIKHPDPEYGRYVWIGKTKVDTWKGTESMIERAEQGKLAHQRKNNSPRGLTPFWSFGTLWK